MAKAYLIIKNKSRYYNSIKKWQERKIHHDQMFYEFLKGIKEQCLGVKLTTKYIYMENPRDLTLIESYPHVVKQDDGLYRFNTRSKLWKQWLEYKETNYIDDVGEIESLEFLLGDKPDKIVYHICGHKILADITYGSHKQIYPIHIEMTKDTVPKDELEFIKASDFLSISIRERGDKYEYRDDD